MLANNSVAVLESAFNGKLIQSSDKLKIKNVSLHW